MSGPLVFAQPSPADPLDEIRQALHAIQQRLAAISSHRRVAPPSATTLTLIDDGEALGALIQAKRLYAARRKRDHLFVGYDLFGEPCWDILLDLFIAGEERNLIGVSSACIAACCPPTTALRWLGVLYEQGVIVRASDPDDARRVHVALSATGTQLMRAYLATPGPIAD